MIGIWNIAKVIRGDFSKRVERRKNEFWMKGSWPKARSWSASNEVFWLNALALTLLGISMLWPTRATTEKRMLPVG